MLSILRGYAKQTYLSNAISGAMRAFHALREALDGLVHLYQAVVLKPVSAWQSSCKDLTCTPLAALSRLVRLLILVRGIRKPCVILLALAYRIVRQTAQALYTFASGTLTLDVRLVLVWICSRERIAGRRLAQSIIAVSEAAGWLSA